ncbi:hypothetical protein RHGRI_018307 [Rhododendron griersonianum]|uniref:Protein FAR1-RELATED SEQUENCE n=1 Tax=Rhododendron griersonianum TaxID=479676 RepID=A0AAV6K0Y9_9ERIC|nr:hypothetical protein RHGRI_018307 [Rhododendron griersonianum]
MSPESVPLAMPPNNECGEQEEVWSRDIEHEEEVWSGPSSKDCDVIETTKDGKEEIENCEDKVEEPKEGMAFDTPEDAYRYYLRYAQEKGFAIAKRSSRKGSDGKLRHIGFECCRAGKARCIASTTMDEYRTHFEKDKALARRFQPVLINEPSQYESHHKCKYTLEALKAAVHLSAMYIPNRHLPDKAIDLIDEAGSKARMESFKKKREGQTSILSNSPDDYWQEIRAVQVMHEVVIRSKKNEDNDASTIEEDDRKLPDTSFPYTFDDDEPMVVVGPGEIAAVASIWSGIPVQKLTADERMFLVGLDEQLKKRVLGQDEAVAAICRAVKRSRVGLKNPKRPIATMLFCGPTGVGKTELAKALAACHFGSEAAMVRLDMSKYMEQHTVSKLIGSAPGYLGYGEGGTLTEAIRKRPFTVWSFLVFKGYISSTCFDALKTIAGVLFRELSKGSLEWQALGLIHFVVWQRWRRRCCGEEPWLGPSCPLVRLQCLCAALNGGESSMGINVNQTQALALHAACSVTTPPVSRCIGKDPFPRFC